MGEEAFVLACTECQCDIISLILDEKMPWPLRRKDLQAFTKRGGFFEIEFAPALRDPARRRHVIGNVDQLLHATRGKSVLLTSAAADTLELLSPADLANFAAVLGLRGPLARRCISEAPVQALQHAVMRRGVCQELPRAVSAVAP